MSSPPLAPPAPAGPPDPPPAAALAPPRSPAERLAFDQEQPPGVVVQALCRPLFHGAVNLDIHADDEMLHFFLYSQGLSLDQAVASYLESGRLIWHTLRQVIRWRFGPGAPLRILDLASGYGRVTRHMVADIPPADVWVADVYAEGVAFQERQFGVHGLVSAADPRQVALPVPFDCIVVSSLFTHLPATRFRAWLRRLGEALVPGGMLLFSVHDLALMPAGPPAATAAVPPAGGADRDAEAGLVFVPQSESGSLSPAEYGTAWMGESFVRSVVDETVHGATVLRVPRGLASFQDLYVVVTGATGPAAGATGATEPVAGVTGTTGPAAGVTGATGPVASAPGAAGTAGGLPTALPPLRIARAADGFVEHCSRLAKRRFLLSGWIGDRVTGRLPSEIRLYLDGVQAAATRDLEPRAARAFAADPTPVAGWRLEVELPPRADADSCRLAVTALASDGDQIALVADSLLGILLRTTQIESFLLKTEEARAAAREAALERDLAGLRHERDELAARRRAMEASRFWKARNLWFRCKRALGLTREE